MKKLATARTALPTAGDDTGAAIEQDIVEPSTLTPAEPFPAAPFQMLETGEITAQYGEIIAPLEMPLPEGDEPPDSDPLVIQVRDPHGFLLFKYDAGTNKIIIKRRSQKRGDGVKVPAAIYSVDVRSLASVGVRNIIAETPVRTFAPDLVDEEVIKSHETVAISGNIPE